MSLARSCLSVNLWLMANTVLIVYPVQNWYLCTKECFKSKQIKYHVNINVSENI